MRDRESVGRILTFLLYLFFILYFLLLARCPIIAERSRVLIGGLKRWPYDVTDSVVPHGESVTFYCKHSRKQCSFPYTQTCFDGRLNPPFCYLGELGTQNWCPV